MDLDPDLAASLASDVDIHVQSFLLAASNHSIPDLRSQLRALPTLINARDGETGFTALHAAISACEDSDQDQDPIPINGAANDTDDSDPAPAPTPDSATTLERAKVTVQWLIQHGARWDALDSEGETPGCVALRLGLADIYAAMVDAGTRAEMLRSRTGGYERLPGDEDGSGDEGADGDGNGGLDGDSVADGGQSGDEEGSLRSGYLDCRLAFDVTAQQGLERDGSWYSAILEATAAKLLPSAGLRILLFSSGHGSVSNAILQALLSRQPSELHVISPASGSTPASEPELETSSSSTKIIQHSSPWPSTLSSLVDSKCHFDAVYIDPQYFQSDDSDKSPYSSFKTLVDDSVPQILTDDGRWTFFNSVGAMKQVTHDVYRNILAMELQEGGWEIEWTEVRRHSPGDSGRGTGEEKGGLERYHLPLCSFFA